MGSGRVPIRFKERTELFDIEDLSTLTVDGLLKLTQHRFKRDDKECIERWFDYLCEERNSKESLDDRRLREIIQKLWEFESLNGINQNMGVAQKPVHLWLRNGNKTNFFRRSYSSLFSRVV
jgi:hypothetical protein